MSINLYVLASNYPYTLDPFGVRTEDFQNRSEGERTFFALVGAYETLIATKGDPRAGNFRMLHANERRALVEEGLVPEAHRAWTLSPGWLSAVEPKEPKPSDLIYVNDKYFYAITKSSAPMNYRLFAGEPSSEYSYWKIQGDISQQPCITQALALGFTHAWAYRDIPEGEGPLRAWDRLDEPETGDPLTVADLGSPINAQQLLELPAGTLFGREELEGLWVTHGDGTASQIEGQRNARMGLGARHDVYDPENEWVSNGWTYQGHDPARIPDNDKEVDPEVLRQKVERLTREKRELEVAHQHDIETIGKRLLLEAERRDWCEEYDEVVESINRSLTKPLSVREQTKSYEVQVEVSYLVTKRVTALSEHEAYTNAEADIGHEDLNASNLQGMKQVSVEENHLPF